MSFAENSIRYRAPELQAPQRRLQTGKYKRGSLAPSPRSSRGEVKTYPTKPCIGFTGALSGNTLSASTRSAMPN